MRQWLLTGLWAAVLVVALASQQSLLLICSLIGIMISFSYLFNNPNPHGVEQMVLQLLYQSPMSTGDLAERVGYSKRHMRRILHDMADRGLIAGNGEIWNLTKLGKRKVPLAPIKKLKVLLETVATP